MLSDPRAVLERLCAERGEDFAGLSRLIERNPAYIQQYVRRGVPRRLHEDDRRKLADYLAIPESMLGGPAAPRGGESGLVSVRRSLVRASAGAGAIPGNEAGKPYFGFDERWLRTLTATPPDGLSIIRVEGDSMAPTLNAGDDILVDSGDSAPRLRDGIYVLRVDDALIVKRLAMHPVGSWVTVQSDNPAYPDWPDCNLSEIHCVGRVIWAGRRID
jgi:phage repressor protein C with HTH and peptisase S24 domain